MTIAFACVISAHFASGYSNPAETAPFMRYTLPLFSSVLSDMISQGIPSSRRSFAMIGSVFSEPAITAVTYPREQKP